MKLPNEGAKTEFSRIRRLRRVGLLFRRHFVEANSSVVVGDGERFVVGSKIDVEAGGSLFETHYVKGDFFVRRPEPKEAARVTKRHPEPDRQISERRFPPYLKRVLKRLGLKGRLHTFRRSFIRFAAYEGVSERVL